MEDFIKAYNKLPFNGMLLEVHEFTDFSIDEDDTIFWDPVDEEYYNYSATITEGIQREEGWVMVNVEYYTGTRITMLFKEENEVKSASNDIQE